MKYIVTLVIAFTLAVNVKSQTYNHHDSIERQIPVLIGSLKMQDYPIEIRMLNVDSSTRNCPLMHYVYSKLTSDTSWVLTHKGKRTKLNKVTIKADGNHGIIYLKGKDYSVFVVNQNSEVLKFTDKELVLHTKDTELIKLDRY